MNKQVFVTYSWSKNEEENEMVYSFVDMLRNKGYYAECDKNKLQQETSGSFSKIMSDGLNKDKVIIVLSEHYKKKAESFQGGVGTEYKIISSEINNTNNKYILVSFDGVDKDTINEIVPKLYQSHQVLDLINDEENNYEELFSKLSDKETIQFSEVAAKSPDIKAKKLKDFTLKSKKKSV